MLSYDILCILCINWYFTFGVTHAIHFLLLSIYNFISSISDHFVFLPPQSLLFLPLPPSLSPIVSFFATITASTIVSSLFSLPPSQMPFILFFTTRGGHEASTCRFLVTCYLTCLVRVIFFTTWYLTCLKQVLVLSSTWKKIDTCK